MRYVRGRGDGITVITLGKLRQQIQSLSLRARGDSLQLDDTDQRIIAALTADARASFAEIGQQVALSAPAVKRRVDRLRATGVIKGFPVIVDPAAIGWTTEAFVELFCTG